jgi:hypothetical protein
VVAGLTVGLVPGRRLPTPAATPVAAAPSGG